MKKLLLLFVLFIALGQSLMFLKQQWMDRIIAECEVREAALRSEYNSRIENLTRVHKLSNKIKTVNAELSDEYALYLASIINNRAKDPELIVALTTVESRFVSDLVGRHQDTGYMQILPSTAKALGYEDADLRDPEDNFSIGIPYLESLIAKYGLEEGVSRYRCGQKKDCVKTKLSKTYVQRVMSLYSKLQENKNSKM